MLFGLVIGSACFRTVGFIVGRWDKITADAAYVLVGIGHLSGEAGKYIQSGRCIPIQKFVLVVVQFGVDNFHWVLVRTLAQETEVFGFILRVIDRRGRVRLDSIVEHVPVGRLALDKSRSHVHHKGKEAILGIVVEAGTGAVFFPFRPLVYACSFSVINADAEIVVHVATGKGDGMLVRQAHSADFLKPVNVAAEVLGRAGRHLAVPEFLGRQHLQVFHHNVRRCDKFVGGVE